MGIQSSKQTKDKAIARQSNDTNMKKMKPKLDKECNQYKTGQIL